MRSWCVSPLLKKKEANYSHSNKWGAGVLSNHTWAAMNRFLTRVHYFTFEWSMFPSCSAKIIHYWIVYPRLTLGWLHLHSSNTFTYNDNIIISLFMWGPHYGKCIFMQELIIIIIQRQLNLLILLHSHQLLSFFFLSLCFLIHLFFYFYREKPILLLEKILEESQYYCIISILLISWALDLPEKLQNVFPILYRWFLCIKKVW